MAQPCGWLNTAIKWCLQMILNSMGKYYVY